MLYQVLPFGLAGFNVAVVVIAIMLSISGIALGIGYALDEKKLKEFGRGEIYQSLINGAILGSFLLLFVNGGIISTIINSAVASSGAGYSCPAYMNSNSALCFAYSYLVSLQGYTIGGVQYSSLFVIITELLIGLLTLSTVLGIIAAIKINLLLVSISFGSILSPLLSELQYLINVVTTLSIGITVQAALLSFVAVAAISMILPLGLILRSFYATRKIGGFLIAVAIGTYVILPLTYLLNASMISSYNTGFDQSSLQQVTSSATSIKNQLFGATGGLNRNDTGIIGLFANGIEGLSQTLNQIFNGIIFFISKLIMQIFILPAFSLIVTGISIRELAQLFGSEAFFGKFDIL